MKLRPTSQTLPADKPAGTRANKPDFIPWLPWASLQLKEKHFRATKVQNVLINISLRLKPSAFL